MQESGAQLARRAPWQRMQVFTAWLWRRGRKLAMQHPDGPVAQLIERRPPKAKVEGSNPFGPPITLITASHPHSQPLISPGFPPLNSLTLLTPCHASARIWGFMKIGLGLRVDGLKKSGRLPLRKNIIAPPTQAGAFFFEVRTTAARLWHLSYQWAGQEKRICFRAAPPIRCPPRGMRCTPRKRRHSKPLSKRTLLGENQYRPAM